MIKVIKDNPIFYTVYRATEEKDEQVGTIVKFSTNSQFTFGSADKRLNVDDMYQIYNYMQDIVSSTPRDR